MIGRTLCLLLVCLAFSLHARADDAQFPVLDAEVIELDGGTLHLDRRYADQRDELIEAVQGLFDAAHDQPERLSPEEIDTEVQKLVEATIEVTGLAVDRTLHDELMTAGKMFLQLLNVRLDPIEAPMTLYLVSTPTARSYARAGGELPDISYNTETGKIRLDLSIGVGSFRDEDQPQQTAFSLMIEPGEDPNTLIAIFESFFTHGLSAMSADIPGIDSDNIAKDHYTVMIIHELVELALFRTLNPYNDPDFRWFSDGFANALAEVAIVEAGYPNAAAIFVTYDDERYQTPDPAINLRYWHTAHYSIKLGDDYPAFQRLLLDRYAYAYVECKRLLDTVGLEAVQGMMRGLQEKQQEQDAGLVDSIEELTGYDIDARLALYQAHDDLAELDTMHLERYIATTSVPEPTREDFERGTIELYLLMEVRTKAQGEIGLIANRLIDRFIAVGDSASAEQVYQALDPLLLNPPSQGAARQPVMNWMYYRCRFAFEHDRLEGAHDLAAQWLDQYAWGDSELETIARVALLVIAADAASEEGEAAAATSRSQEARDLLPHLTESIEGTAMRAWAREHLDMIEQALQAPRE